MFTKAKVTQNCLGFIYESADTCQGAGSCLPHTSLSVELLVCMGFPCQQPPSLDLLTGSCAITPDLLYLRCSGFSVLGLHFLMGEKHSLSWVTGSSSSAGVGFFLPCGLQLRASVPSYLSSPRLLGLCDCFNFALTFSRLSSFVFAFAFVFALFFIFRFLLFTWIVSY